MTDYSLKMQEIFSRAQYQAARYQSQFLESWHLLLAMVDTDETVAHLALMDFADKIDLDEYEDAAMLVIRRKPLKRAKSQEILPASRALERILTYAARIAEAVKAPQVGSEHVLLSMMFGRDNLAARILEQVGFHFQDEGKDNLRLTYAKLLSATQVFPRKMSRLFLT